MRKLSMRPLPRDRTSAAGGIPPVVATVPAIARQPNRQSGAKRAGPPEGPLVVSAHGSPPEEPEQRRAGGARASAGAVPVRSALGPRRRDVAGGRPRPAGARGDDRAAHRSGRAGPSRRPWHHGAGAPASADDRAGAPGAWRSPAAGRRSPPARR